MALKIYKTIDHKGRVTRYAYVCASSKARVAEILNTTLGQLNKYGCTALDGAELSQYKHLKDGEVTYEDAFKPVKAEGINTMDLHRIAAVGYIDAALHALDQCDITNREISQRLGELRGQLRELKGDVKDALELKYRGR